MSWSDTDLNKGLTVEFTYPKYSYEDYFEIDHNSVEETDSSGGKSTDSNELATPIHPSLSSPSKNSDSTDFSSPTSAAGSGSFGDSSGGTGGSFGGSAQTFSFSGMPSLGSFMSAYTSGSGGMSNSYSSPSSGNSSSFDQPTEKQNPIVETNKEEEEIDENAAALLW